jgi:hypothetical protein
MQADNAAAVCNENQIVVAAEIGTDSPDFGHLEALVCTAERELAGLGIAEAPAVVVADTGYWHHDQMDQLASRGISPDRTRCLQTKGRTAGLGRRPLGAVMRRCSTPSGSIQAPPP